MNNLHALEEGVGFKFQDLNDQHVAWRTGRPVEEWMNVLEVYFCQNKRFNDSEEFLRDVHRLSRYWARTLTKRYLRIDRLG